MKPDAWADATWDDVQPGDVVRKKSEPGTLWRVDGRDGNRFALYSARKGSVTGSPALTSSVQIRIAKNGELTEAGRRDDGLTDAGEAALKRILGAELLAQQSFTGRLFQPLVHEPVPAPDLGGHLFFFHEYAVPNPKKEDWAELVRIHREAHDTDSKVETARRIPHVHRDPS